MKDSLAIYRDSSGRKLVSIFDDATTDTQKIIVNVGGGSVDKPRLKLVPKSNVSTMKLIESTYEKVFAYFENTSTNQLTKEHSKTKYASIILKILDNPFVSVLPQHREAFSNDVIKLYKTALQRFPGFDEDLLFDFLVLNQEQNRIFWNNREKRRTGSIVNLPVSKMPAKFLMPHSIVSKLFGKFADPHLVQSNRKWFAEEILGCELKELDLMSEGELRLNFVNSANPIGNIQSAIRTKKLMGFDRDDITNEGWAEYIGGLVDWDITKIKTHFTAGLLQQIIKASPEKNGIRPYESKIQKICRDIDNLTPSYIADALKIDLDFVTRVFGLTAIVKQYIIQRNMSALEKMERLLSIMQQEEGISMASTDNEIKSAYGIITIMPRSAADRKELKIRIATHLKNKYHKIKKGTELMQQMRSLWNHEYIEKLTVFSGDEVKNIFTEPVLKTLSTRVSSMHEGDAILREHASKHSIFWSSDTSFWEELGLDSEEFHRLSMSKKNQITLQAFLDVIKKNLKNLFVSLEPKRIAEISNADPSFIEAIFTKKFSTELILHIYTSQKVHSDQIFKIYDFFKELNNYDAQGLSDNGYNDPRIMQQILISSIGKTGMIRDLKKNKTYKERGDIITHDTLMKYTGWDLEKVRDVFPQQQIDVRIIHKLKRDPWQYIENIKIAHEYMTNVDFCKRYNINILTESQKKQICWRMYGVSPINNRQIIHDRIVELMGIIQKKLTGVYSVEHIAQTLGDAISKEFLGTFTLAKRIAMSLDTNGVGEGNGVEKFKKIYETLNVPAIIENLGWTKNEAREFLAIKSNITYLGFYAQNIFINIDNTARGLSVSVLSIPKSVLERNIREGTRKK